MRTRRGVGLLPCQNLGTLIGSRLLLGNQRLHQWVGAVALHSLTASSGACAHGRAALVTNGVLFCSRFASRIWLVFALHKGLTATR